MKVGTKRAGDERSTSGLFLRVRASEKLAFERSAQIAGISVAAWIRERLRLAAARELEAVGQKIPFAKDLTL
jgi:hypothetical protein